MEVKINRKWSFLIFVILCSTKSFRSLFLEFLTKFKYYSNNSRKSITNSNALSKRISNSVDLQHREFQHPNFQTSHFMRGRLLNRPGVIEYGHCHYSEADSSLVTFIKLGEEVDGHLGVVHGGLIASLFDDLFGELFWCLFKHKYVNLSK